MAHIDEELVEKCVEMFAWKLLLAWEVMEKQLPIGASELKKSMKQAAFSRALNKILQSQI